MAVTSNNAPVLSLVPRVASDSVDASALDLQRTGANGVDGGADT